MKGQEAGPGLGMIYLTFFILLVGVGGYWILRSNTFIDYNMLYGPPKSIDGKITRVEQGCENPKKTLVMLDNGKSQFYVYMGFRFDVAVGDSLTATAYNVTGRGLLFDLTRAECEPVGAHFYAIKAYNSRTTVTMEGRPWQK
ncbi:MAG: hypothetical protein V1909_04425 [Candidatus Micrarchaeota archaeon]